MRGVKIIRRVAQRALPLEVSVGGNIYTEGMICCK